MRVFGDAHFGQVLVAAQYVPIVRGMIVLTSHRKAMLRGGAAALHRLRPVPPVKTGFVEPLMLRPSLAAPTLAGVFRMLPKLIRKRNK